MKAKWKPATTMPELPEDEGGGRGLPILLALIVIGVVVYMFMARGTPEEYTEACKKDHYASHQKAAQGLVKITCMRKDGTEYTVMLETDK